MKFHLSNNPGQNIFTAHGEGYVQVNEQRYHKPLIVTPDAIFSDWSASSFARLSEADFLPFLELKPEILLLGTGKQHLFALPETYRSLVLAGIGVEFMNTPAACRTYNILAGEERKVAVGILFE